MSTQQSRSDAIYASLRRAILEQALKPGVKLPEDSIGDTFGVSRTSARNALLRLASDGLVTPNVHLLHKFRRNTTQQAFSLYQMDMGSGRVHLLTHICLELLLSYPSTLLVRNSSSRLHLAL